MHIFVDSRFGRDGRHALFRLHAASWPSIAVLVALVGLTACSSTPRNIVVARVGNAVITRNDVAAWMRTLAPDHFVPDPPHYVSCVAFKRGHGEEPIGTVIREDCASQFFELKSMALRFLITSYWLIAEARNRRPATARHLIAERALALRTVDKSIRDTEAPVTQAQISRYYARHLARFERRERRYIDITENIRTEAGAYKVLKRLVSLHGRGTVAIHEFYDRPHRREPVPIAKRAVFEAIFAARPGVYIGPMRLNGSYAIFRVTRIVPRAVQPLSTVRETIKRELGEAQHRRTLARFLQTWTRRWKAVTRCRATDLVPECRSYPTTQPDSDALVGLH